MTRESSCHMEYRESGPLCTISYTLPNYYNIPDTTSIVSAALARNSLGLVCIGLAHVAL